MKGRRGTGERAEAAAVLALEQLGMTIVERNWRCRSGELDLVAVEGNTLVFVEVRSRTIPSRFGTAVEAIDPRKCRQVRMIATIYMKLKGELNRPIRFDVIAVTFRADGAIEELKHLPGAF